MITAIAVDNRVSMNQFLSCLMTLSILVVIVSMAQGQDWANRPGEELEYDCGFVPIITISFGNVDLMRDNSGVKTVYQFFAGEVIEGCVTDFGTGALDRPPRWVAGVESGSEWNCAAVEALSLEWPTWHVARRNEVEYTLADYFKTLAPDCVDEQEVAKAIATLVYVPEWGKESTGRFQVNCRTLLAISDQFGRRDFWRDGDTLFSFEELYRWIGADCFNTYAQDDADPQESYIVASVGTYLRECAGSTCAAVGRIPQGAVLTVRGEAGGWYHVDFGTRSGYIAGWLTEPEDQRLRWEQGPFHTIVSADTELRDCASESCDAIGEANSGDVFEVVNRVAGWEEVLIAGGTAFIQTLVTEAGPDSILEEDQAAVAIESNDCIVWLWFYNSSRLEISFVLRHEVDSDWRVDFYHPADRYSLRLVDPTLKTVVERANGVPSHMYTSYEGFGPGLYIVEIEVDGIVGRVGFNAPYSTGYEINALC